MQRDGGDDDRVAAREQVRRRRVAEPVDVVVPRAVLLDVEVGLGDVRLGLVVVVVRDEVLDRVVREELAELVAELRGERLVVRDHERRALELLDDPGHRRRLAGAGRAEQRLVALAGSEAGGERLDRPRLVAGRRVVGRGLQLGHDDRVSAGSGPNRTRLFRTSRSEGPIPNPHPPKGKKKRPASEAIAEAVTTSCQFCVESGTSRPQPIACRSDVRDPASLDRTRDRRRAPAPGNQRDGPSGKAPAEFGAA